MAARWNPNLYFDLSGSSLKAKPPQFFDQLLWWTETSQYRDPEGRHAWAKIVFGSDVEIRLIEDVMNDFQRTMDAIGLARSARRRCSGTPWRSWWACRWGRAGLSLPYPRAVG